MLHGPDCASPVSQMQTGNRSRARRPEHRSVRKAAGHRHRDTLNVGSRLLGFVCGYILHVKCYRDLCVSILSISRCRGQARLAAEAECWRHHIRVPIALADLVRGPPAGYRHRDALNVGSRLFMCVCCFFICYMHTGTCVFLSFPSDAEGRLDSPLSPNVGVNIDGAGSCSPTWN